MHRIQVGPRGASVSERPVGPADPVRLVTVSGLVHRPYPHKTTDRAQFAHAMDQARTRGADDGVLLAEGGWVAEAGIWSLFWWEDGRAAAPPLALGVLPGVARARIAEQTGGVVERRVQVDQLRARSPVRGKRGAWGGRGGGAGWARGASKRGHNGARTRLLVLTQPCEGASFAARTRSPWLRRGGCSSIG